MIMVANIMADLQAAIRALGLAWEPVHGLVSNFCVVVDRPKDASRSGSRILY